MVEKIFLSIFSTGILGNLWKHDFLVCNMSVWFVMSCPDWLLSVVVFLFCALTSLKNYLVH